MKVSDPRYSELDWLRVFLILAVFVHHVFLPFHGHRWHVMNSESSRLLDDTMIYFEQIRLHTLFFISGAGTAILLSKVNAKEFLFSKFHRLFVPFVIAVVIVVPPQVYYENINNYESLISAYQSEVFSFNLYHLWFVEFLFVFMLLAVPLNGFLNTSFGNSVIFRLEKLTQHKHGLLSLVLVIALFRLGLKAVMPSQSLRVENLSVSMFYLLFFIAGMCVMKTPKLWRAIAASRKTSLKWLIASTILFYFCYLKCDVGQYSPSAVRQQLWWLVCTLVSWSGVLTLVGYASAVCVKSPKWLVATNEMIYPFYIVHQTVIVAIGFYIVQWNAGMVVKSFSLLVIALISCVAICYFLIRPFNIMRYIFGLKVNLLAR